MRRCSPATARRATSRATGRQQYFVSPTLKLAYLALNTSRPLFSDVRLRKAVNYAIDRRALARIGSWVSGPFASIPTDQYLPPTMPGASPTVIYPPNGDLRTARRLAPDAHGTAVLYTCDDYPPLCRRPAQQIKENLAALGLDVDIREFPSGELVERAGTRGEPFDLVVTQWGADYADPENFLNVLLDQRIRPRGNLNLAYYQRSRPRAGARPRRAPLGRSSLRAPTPRCRSRSPATPRRGWHTQSAARAISSRLASVARSSSPCTAWTWALSACAAERPSDSVSGMSSSPAAAGSRRGAVHRQEDVDGRRRRQSISACDASGVSVSAVATTTLQE